MAQAVIKNAARHHFMDFCSTLGRLSSSSKPIKNAPKCIILNIEFQNFLGGDTPEPPLREGTLTPGHPLWQFLATPLVLTQRMFFGRPGVLAVFQILEHLDT